MSKQIPSCRRPAFTLVEMLVSLSIISIVMLALGSVVVLAGRALTTATSGSASQAALARSAIDMMTSDLEVAISITEQTSTAVTVTVPPRGADISPETIRYAWDGVAGHSLTRQYNSGAALSIADNVTTLNFQFLTRTAGP
jgi:prepilin-type N-terminal cleavage/methylation domain-containing protein